MITTKTKTNSIQSSHFIDPVYVIAQMNIDPGSVIADFGCGAGFFSIPLSAVVGKEGRVYAIDVLPQALESVSSHAKLLGASNITPKRTNLENEKGSGLPKDVVDWVIMKDMLHQNANKEAIINEAYRILKPSGRALIIEWNKEGSLIGPDNKVRLEADEIIAMLKKRNFVVDKIIKTGTFHYGMIVKK